jgi:hypothetical protein
MRFSLFLLFSLAILFSCEKENDVTANSVEENIEVHSNKANFSDGKISIKCTGNCDSGTGDCGITGSGTTVRCSCSGCKLVLREVDKKTGISEKELSAAEAEFLGWAMSDVNKRYGTADKIDVLEIERRGADVIIQLFFTGPRGEKESIMYHRNLLNNAGGGTE